MRIEALQAFVAVAELRSLSKAAEQLYVSLPTVSRYVGELEKYLNGALFIRNAHMCELTILGKQIYVHVRRIVNEWESIGAVRKRGDNENRQNIRIGFAYDE